MLLSKETLQHINSITHEGKVVIVGTDTDGKIWYTVKQDGFEEQYLNQKPEERTGWESWKPLEFPDESEDPSVIDKESEELTHQQDDSLLMASRYSTNFPSPIAPVQLVSGLGYIYVFRQSYSHTLFVDRFVLDGLENTLNRKLEVRFKRSKQRYKPSQTQKKGATGLTTIDSLDFKDINGNEFYEPTTILNIIPGCVDDGLFSVVLLPTSEQDKYRWHIFSYNSQNKKVELTTIRASDDGLFDLKDYTVLDPEPRSIPGIIQRTFDLGNITVAKGLTATKYDLQLERQTDDGMQLLKESVRVLLAVGTSEGNVATISFAAAADGTLSQIKDRPDSTTILHSTTRQILLPLDTLEQIKAISNSNPPPQGMIARIARGEEDGVVLTSDKATGLDEAKITQVKVEGNQDYNRLYSQVTKIDDNTFEISPETTNGGTWEVIPEEEAGLIYNGIVTAYEITKTGKLKVTAFNHGLTNGDSVQIVDAQDYNGTYTVTKLDSKTFSLDGVKWQAGTAISAKLQSQKRRGVIFDGVGDYIELPLSGKVLSSDFTVEAWIKPSALGGTDVLNSILGTDRNSKNQGLQLIVRGQTPHFGFYGNDTFGQISLSANTWYHVAFRYSKDKQEQAIFVNGVLDNSTDGHIPFAGTDQLKIGSSLEGNYFHGCIADVRIWNTVRTEADIKNNMYLQLTGKELGLVGYWRLDGIVEGKKRKVIDFSLEGNDGIVHGDAYLSSVTLNRNLSGTSIAASKYENEELFAVSERATYTEEFEFKTNSNINPNNADGQNGQIFAFTYKGKKNRSSQKWHKKIYTEATEFTDLGDNWYKASSRFTVPDGVSVVRSFGISDLKGNWNTLDIRKHKIQLISDSITETKYTDSVTLTTLGDSQAKLRVKLQEVKVKEQQETVMLTEKQDLEARIALVANLANLQQEANTQQTLVNALVNQEQTLHSAYQTALNSPFNYFCKIKAAGETRNCYGNNIYIFAQRDTDKICGYNQVQDQWQFIHQGGNVYKIKAAGKLEIAMGIISISLPNARQIKSVDTIRFKINGSLFTNRVTFM